MNSFFKDRQSVIKKNIIDNLSECVKALQFGARTEVGGASAYTNTGEEEGLLCSALEALFLHGVKDSFMSRARMVFSESSKRPEPSFWPCVLILSHKDTVRTLTNLGQVKSEVGLCRAWIRMTLNEGLISSHLSSLCRDPSTAKPFYRKSAILLDSELLDVGRRLLDGLESCMTFELPINSSLLNAWTEDTLILAGICTSGSAFQGVAPAFDVASALIVGESTVTLSPTTPDLDPDLLGLGRMLAMDQEEALNYIISNVPASQDNETETEIEKNFLETINTPIDKIEENETIQQQEEIIEPKNDITEPTIPIADPIEVEEPKQEEDFDANPEKNINSEESGNKSPISGSSLSMLDFETEHVAVHSEMIRGLREELKIVDEEKSTNENETNIPATDNENDNTAVGLGFEMITSEFTSFFDATELNFLRDMLGKIARESGLDSQFYQCANCTNMLRTVGKGPSEARVCYYTGKYFCENCIHPDVFMIPSKVIHNWDFKRYTVSKKAATFLLEFQNHPLLNMKKINPLIYDGVEKMTQLLILRIKLNSLRNYLFSCREPVIKDLQKRVWPREYLYEKIHVYSISDLALISNGSFASHLQKVITFAQNHVSDCWLCSQKGFICEVCRNPKILYPFNIESIFRCDVCFSVFHINCLTKTDPCPKCERKKKRQGASLVNVVHSNS